MPIGIDILENEIFRHSPGLLNTLLKDHTTSEVDVQHNIFWATSDYEYLGDGYQYNSPILPHLVTGDNGHIIMPRVLKSRDTKSARSKSMAEVFTPSWVCNAQINLVDEAWFGRKDVFNTEYTDEQGCHRWKTTDGNIVFPDNKTWKDYVLANRLEITCGEAPYIVSRYDTTTGEAIPLEERIGMLDRKLRVVGENTETSSEWLEWAQEAYKSIYAYEWQGDNLLLARENMLASFIEYYQQKFGKFPLLKSVNYIAYIVSWNVWQMDGLKCVVPGSCHSVKETVHNLFDTHETVQECKGCRRNDIHNHNGIYCKIMDWKEDKVITFVSLIKEKKEKKKREK